MHEHTQGCYQLKLTRNMNTMVNQKVWRFRIHCSEHNNGKHQKRWLKFWGCRIVCIVFRRCCILQSVIKCSMYCWQSDTVDLDCPLFEVTDEDHYDTRSYDINCGAVGHFSIPNTRQVTCDAIIRKTGEFDLDSPG